MSKVKTAFEKAMEKVAEIGELTIEEKERIKDQEKLRSVLAEFYRGKLDRDGLWERLKGSKPLLLREAQHHLIDSLGLGSTSEEFQQKKDGILAIETLKGKQHTTAIEHALKSIESLQKEYGVGKEKAIDELRAAIERNPQLRLQPVRTPNGRSVVQATLSVDEAVQARLEEFLSEHEERYSAKFSRTVEKLKKEL